MNTASTVLAPEDLLERAPDSRRAAARRAGHRDDGVVTDMAQALNRPRSAEERRALADRARIGVVAGELGDLPPRPEDQRRALVQALRRQREDRVDAVGGAAARPAP